MGSSSSLPTNMETAMSASPCGTGPLCGTPRSAEACVKSSSAMGKEVSTPTLRNAPAREGSAATNATSDIVAIPDTAPNTVAALSVTSDTVEDNKTRSSEVAAADVQAAPHIDISLAAVTTDEEQFPPIADIPRTKYEQREDRCIINGAGTYSTPDTE